MSMDQENEKNAETEKVRGRSRKKGSGTAIKIAAAVAVILAIGVVGYMVWAQRYQNVFFPNTTINGLDASGQTVDQVKEQIVAGINGYVLTLEERGSGEVSAVIEERILGADIDLHPEFDGSLETLLYAQEPYAWGTHLWKRQEYTIETMVVYDGEKLDTIIGELACMDPQQTEEPVDAYVSDYIDGVGYEVVDEEYGNTPDRERLTEAVTAAICNLAARLSLDESDVYTKPSVTAEDETLKATAEKWNRVTATVVTYLFGSTEEVLDGSTTHDWFAEDDQGIPQLDTACVEEYVKALAEKYDTVYTERTIQTTYGSEATVNGPYGWKIDQSVEAAALAEILISGESQEREPVYSQTAASHDGYDFGDTYVEINLSAQHLYYYVDGSLLLESDFVSGNESRNMGTPTGIYPLTYKQRNATLRGEGYATPVSYWMPFNRGVGMHDASWRGSFGGNIYKTNGSHGCINLPSSVAKTIYENISAGTPVLVYKLSGTESTERTTVPASSRTTSAAAETTAAVVEETTAEETLPAETEEETIAGPAGVSPVQEVGSPTVSGGPGVTQAETSSQENEGPGVTQASEETVAAAPEETAAAAPENVAPVEVPAGPGSASTQEEPASVVGPGA
ncbi:MAG: L,D-transpeptidase/peptidoglycan binding protein [Clostridiales bacterium]|nr:L,D-transpeptidase/peptidoglycan binding protein [Clostridiales bacterium]